MRRTAGTGHISINSFWRISAFLCLFIAFTFRTWADTGAPPMRVPNTTLGMPVNPDGDRSGQFRTVEAWPALVFDQPVAIASPPGDAERLFVVERSGRILVVTNLANPRPTVFLDIRSAVDADWDKGKVEGLSSVAFHPGYMTNRFPFLYVTYTLRLDGPEGPGNYNRLSRFQASRAIPNAVLPETELPLITQIDRGDGHNFNSLTFGADGYLYMAVGDEGDGGTGDDFNNAQRIDKNFFSAILRIDVDKRPTNLLPNPHPANTTNYFVPADNPWVRTTNFNGAAVDPASVRSEFYAVGLRNPWRMAFDPLTDLLYEADVGQHGREEINIIVKGGNYGWSFREGTLNGPKGPAPEGVVLIDPIHEYGPGYGPDQGFSVIGGLVYRGPSLPELDGSYVFADYVSGNVWSLRYDGERTSEVQRLTAHTGIAGFGVDPRNGELLLIDHDKGKLFKLERIGPPTMEIPETLDATGAFADLETLTPNAGVVPYDLNVPFWSDGADKRRWFSVPNMADKIGFSEDANWVFPTGMVWIKHFELTNAVSGPVRRLETRLLVKTSSGVYGATYRWGDSLTNAVLVPPEGLDEPFAIHDDGVIRTQVWRYPSRSECLACHTPSAGYALGFNTAQLNRAGPFGAGVSDNQIHALSLAGYFHTTVSNIHILPALANLRETNVSREFRVRSYLAANCVSCHQPGASGYGSWDARVTIPLRQAGIINGSLFNSDGNPENRVVTPGSPTHSMLLTRIAHLGGDRMPPIASRELDTQAIELLRAWITNDLPQHQSYPDWQTAFFAATNSPTATEEADPDADGAVNWLEYLVGRNPLDPADAWKIGIRQTNDIVEIVFPQAANRLFQVQFTDDLSSPRWQPLDVQANRPFAAASNFVNIVPAPMTNATRFYRVFVREP